MGKPDIVRSIPTDKLRIDESYQRVPRGGHISRIVEEFDPNRLDPLLVNERSGIFYIIDGSHRYEAAKLLEIKSLPCRVLVGLSVAEEAQLFYEVNSARLRASGYDKFKSLLRAGDPQTLEINELIRKQGWKVSAAYGPALVNAISTVESVYNRDGADGLDETLSLIKATWNGSDRATEGQMIAGVAYLVRENHRAVNNKKPGIDPAELARKVGYTAPMHIMGEAKYQNKVMGGGIPLHVARQIQAAYNKGRRTKARVV